MGSQIFCTPCQHTILAALKSKVDSDSEGDGIGMLHNIPANARVHDQLSEAGFFASRKSNRGPVFTHPLQKNLRESDDTGSDSESDKETLANSSKSQLDFDSLAEDDSQEEVLPTDTANGCDELTELSSGSDFSEQCDESDDSGDSHVQLAESIVADEDETREESAVVAALKDSRCGEEEPINEREQLEVSNDDGELSNPFESQLTFESLRRLHQNCPHCVAVGNSLVKKDARGVPQIPCPMCGKKPAYEVSYSSTTITGLFDGTEVDKTGPCCQTMSRTLVSAKNGCPLCCFLLKQLSRDELEKLMEPSRNGILRHSWAWLTGSKYRSFTYYYGCDQKDLTDYVARRSVHFSVDDSASELGLQEEGLESDEEAIEDILLENATKMTAATTDSEACMALARRWLRACRMHHKCYEQFQSHFSKEVSSTGRQTSQFMSIRSRVIQRQLPTRLLRLETTTDVRLCVTHEMSRREEYMTLSHCWGKIPTTRLERHTLSLFQQKIPFDLLPQTFKDAILITRKWFRCKYLWIDSLCIIQDDQADWERESARMGSIYAFSMLNIAAAHGTNSLSGCFAQRTPGNLSRAIARPSGGLPGHVYEFMAETEEIWQRCVQSSPLYGRGWVFQERILAPRTLYFCESQIIWGCHEERHFEGCNSYGGKFEDVVDLSWDDMVGSYSRCVLTRDEDKLVAISGLARVKQTFIRSPYIAGLWKVGLPRNLLWRTIMDRNYPKPFYPSQYRAPSWSWAAINGPVSLDHPFKYKKRSHKYLKKIEDLIDVKDIHIDNINDSFGQVRSGHMTFRGGLLPLWISSKLSLSIIDGKQEMYDAIACDFKLSGEAYIDVQHPGTEKCYGLPIIGIWKYLQSEKRVHVYLEGLLLTKVSGEQGTYRRVGTFIVFEPYNGMKDEAWHSINKDDYIREDTPHKRGFPQYVCKII